MVKRMALRTLFILLVATLVLAVVGWLGAQEVQKQDNAAKPITLSDDQAKVGKILFSNFQERNDAVGQKQRELEAAIESRIEARTALISEAERQRQSLKLQEPLCLATQQPPCYDVNFQAWTFTLRAGSAARR